MAQPNVTDPLRGEVERCSRCLGRLRAELARVVVGQERFVEQVLIGLLASGHVLVEGVPGLAKTLLLRTLASAAQLEFRRIEFTPDLTLEDLIGCSGLGPSAGQDELAAPTGPLSAHVILADQIDRGPPKTQAAFLDAIHQGEVVAGGARMPLAKPLFVVATRNPADQEGTYRVGQSALDRFLMHLRMEYPRGEDEWEIARRGIAAVGGRVEPLTDGEEILRFQQLLGRLPISDPVLRYAWTLVRATRPQSAEAPEMVDRWFAWGAGPRAVVALAACAKARAILCGRWAAKIADVEAMAPAVLRHRVAPNEIAQADALSADKLIHMLMEAIRREHHEDYGLP